jgi:phosphohistidine phosphatase
MARPILEAGCSFGHAFCSIARRTQLTIEGIAEVLPEQNITWKLEEDLYTFSAHDLLDWIREQDDDLVELVLIGHNPAMTDLVNALGNRSVLNVPTCGYAQIRFDADHWAELAPGAGVTAAFLTPKSLS